MRSGRVSQTTKTTTSNIYGGKNNEEIPLLYDEESYNVRSDLSLGTMTIVSAEAKVDEGAAQPNVPVQMDMAFLPATALQVNSFRPLLLVVASLVLLLVIYKIVVHDVDIALFVTAICTILFCGVCHIVMTARDTMGFVETVPGGGLCTAVGFSFNEQTNSIIATLSSDRKISRKAELNLSEAAIQKIQVSYDIYIPYLGGDIKHYSKGFNEYTKHVHLLREEYKGLPDVKKKDFVEKRIIYHFHNLGRTFFRGDKSKDDYVPFDLDKKDDLVILRNKVMQKIRDIKVVEIQNQPVGNESVNSICDPTAAKALIGEKDTFASIRAAEYTPISNSLSTTTATARTTDTATATSNHITPSPQKKRKIGREEHHVQEGRTLFHESDQAILTTPNRTAKCDDLSGVAIHMSPKEVEESKDIFIINSNKRNIKNSKGFNEYTKHVRSLSQHYKNLPREEKRGFVKEKIINHFHDLGCRFLILDKSEDYYIPFNLDEKKELLFLTSKVMQKIRDIKSA